MVMVLNRKFHKTYEKKGLQGSIPQKIKNLTRTPHISD